MILSIQDRLRYWLRLAVYGPGAGSIVHRFLRRRNAPAIHETAEYWNQELSGRMLAPNINGRISNGLRDMTSVLLIRLCGPPPRTVLDLGCGFGDLHPKVRDVLQGGDDMLTLRAPSGHRGLVVHVRHYAKRDDEAGDFLFAHLGRPGNAPLIGG